MPYNEAVLRRARERLDEARQARSREDEARISAIYARQPRLQEIDLKLRAAVAQAASAAFRKGEDPTGTIEAMKTESLALQRERRELMDADGLTEADMKAHPVCPDCGGTGYLGARMCRCLRSLCQEEQTRELTRLLPSPGSFEGFRLDYYSDRFDPTLGGAPRTVMENVLRRCVRYAEEFSENAPSLIFSGATGLGKTFLSAAIARAVSDKGFSVVYESAGAVFSDFEREKFNGASGLTGKYLDCDLMILDDLGAEMTTEFTRSALYALLNGRILKEKPFLVSTNLFSDEIRRRYTPQIASRLLGTAEILTFVGSDIRFIKK